VLACFNSEKADLQECEKEMQAINEQLILSMKVPIWFANQILLSGFLLFIDACLKIVIHNLVLE